MAHRSKFAGYAGLMAAASMAFTPAMAPAQAAEVTPVSEIGDYRFSVGEITKSLMHDYEMLVREAPAIAAE